MNFTRDPIIETVITPKEGFKLLVRSSTQDKGDEYQVDAIEVVSFGKSMFYRSLEKPKAFLLPVSDYEVIEVKETRVVLKKASLEKPIKIAGGKKEEPKEEKPKKKTKRTRKSAKKKQEETPEIEEENAEPPPPRKMRALIPPPSGLISESISKYKETLPPEEEEELKAEDESLID